MKKTILLSLALIAVLMAQAQVSKKVNESANASSTLSWTKYTTTEGLPSNSIKDILFDKNGVLWIATPSGVSKYNGTTFQNYTVADGLHSNAIGRLYCDNQNRIWAIGDYSAPGLSIYNGTWQPFDKNSSVPSPGFVFQDVANNIYITEGAGKIYKYDGTQIQLLLQTTGLQATNAIFDSNGILWVVGYEKLYKYSGSTLLETKTLTSNGVGSTYIIEKDKLGKLWIIMGNSLYKSDDLSTFSLLGTTTSNYYMDIAFDSNNTTFLARYSKANGGIKTYNGSTWGEYTGTNGLTSVTVQSVAIASNDKVWAGADDGLYCSSAAITGVENISKNDISIYPNSVSDKFIISGLSGNGRLTLLDLNGKTLLAKLVVDNESVSINSFPKGMYVVKIATSNGQYIQKLIKN